MRARHIPWTLALGVLLLCAPSSARAGGDGDGPRTGFVYQDGQGLAYTTGEGQAWLSMEQEGGGEGEGETREVRVVVVGAGEGEPKVEWKIGEDEMVRLPQEGWAFLGPMARRGYLGVQLVDLTPELRLHFGASEDAGVLIGKVDAGSPAEEAGLQVGDVLTRVQGERVASSRDVRLKVRSLEDGESASLGLVRGRRSLELSATIVEKERPELDIRPFVGHLGHMGLGRDVSVYSVDSEEIAEQLDQVRAQCGSPEFRARIRGLHSLEGQLEKRIEELEKRLEGLEKGLAEK